MAFPLGWGQNEVDATADLAERFGADPEDILALWNSESGLFFRCGTPSGGCNAIPGYFGLIQGYDAFVTPVIGQSWRVLVTSGTLLEQIAAIKKLWSAQESQLGEPIAARASRLGVAPAAVLYSINFVPAYFRNMKTADQPMVIRGGGPDGGQYYRDNPGFDLDNKGYITVRDVQARIDRKKQEGYAASRTRDLFFAAGELSSNPYANVSYRPGGGTTKPKTEWGNILLGVGIVGLTTAGLVYAVKRSRRAA
jgi:hypothetical protein